MQGGRLERGRYTVATVTHALAHTCLQVQAYSSLKSVGCLFHALAIANALFMTDVLFLGFVSDSICDVNKLANTETY